MGKKRGFPGSSVEILKPKDGSNIYRGKIEVIIEAKTFGWPPESTLSFVSLRWKKAKKKIVSSFF